MMALVLFQSLDINIFSLFYSKEYDNEMKIINEEVKLSDLKPSVHMYQIIQRFLLVWKKERDKERFEKLCR